MITKISAHKRKDEYYDHCECNGRLEKEPYRYIVSKLRDNSKFKEICKEWNKTISHKKFIGEIINPYNKNKIIIQTYIIFQI